MDCRAGCGACCIAPSISTAIPGMPAGKPAGVRCAQLTADNRCRLFGRPERPAFCASLRPRPDMCGASAAEALAILERMERETLPTICDPSDNRGMKTTAEIVRRARELGVAIPAFNIPFPPMMAPVVRATVDEDSFALVEVARIEWLTFEIEGLARFMQEFEAVADLGHVRAHLDHVPVVDEEGLPVDYRPIIEEAIARGFHSVMVDGSRLALQENIAATRAVVSLAHAAAIPCEAELGAILRFGVGELPPYEELFASGQGFTRVEEAARFVAETGCDWLSVAIGNIHGAVSAAFRDRPKGESRLSLPHLAKLAAATGVPLVLHGGSGVRHEDVLAARAHGIAKVNVGFEIRKAYEEELVASGTVTAAQGAVYRRTAALLRDYFQISGIAGRILA